MNKFTEAAMGTAKDMAAGAKDIAVGARQRAVSAYARASGQEAVQMIEDYCRKYTQVLLGLHGDLQAHVEQNERVIARLGEIEKQLLLLGNHPARMEEVERKLAELSDSVSSIRRAIGKDSVAATKPVPPIGNKVGVVALVVAGAGVVLACLSFLVAVLK